MIAASTLRGNISKHDVASARCAGYAVSVGWARRGEGAALISGPLPIAKDAALMDLAAHAPAPEHLGYGLARIRVRRDATNYIQWVGACADLRPLAAYFRLPGRQG